MHHHPAPARVGQMPSIMIKYLFVCGVLGVLLVPAKCSNITVCIEENGELRVDCLIHSKALKPESYSFFWSSGPKQMLINSNVSGSSVDNQFKGKSVVTERELGYRMNLRGFTENLPQNPTFICRVNDESAQISLGKEQIEQCSAISVFLQSCSSWIVYLTLFYQLLG